MLAAIPFEDDVVAGEDSGRPPVLAHPAGPVARAFASLASSLAPALGFTVVDP